MPCRCSWQKCKHCPEPQKRCAAVSAVSNESYGQVMTGCVLERAGRKAENAKIQPIRMAVFPTAAPSGSKCLYFLLLCSALLSITYSILLCCKVCFLHFQSINPLKYILISVKQNLKIIWYNLSHKVRQYVRELTRSFPCNTCAADTGKFLWKLATMHLQSFVPQHTWTPTCVKYTCGW